MHRVVEIEMVWKFGADMNRYYEPVERKATRRSCREKARRTCAREVNRAALRSSDEAGKWGPGVKGGRKGGRLLERKELKDMKENSTVKSPMDQFGEESPKRQSTQKPFDLVQSYCRPG